MNIFHDMFDMGDNIIFNLGGKQIVGKVCGTFAHKEQDGTYKISYQVKYEDEKIIKIEEKDIIK